LHNAIKNQLHTFSGTEHTSKSTSSRTVLGLRTLT
jgi:hypothetical protein